MDNEAGPGGSSGADRPARTPGTDDQNQAADRLQCFYILLSVLHIPANLEEQIRCQKILENNPELMSLFTRREQSAILEANAEDREWTKSLRPEERDHQISEMFSRLNAIPLLVNPGRVMEVEFWAYAYAGSRVEYYLLLEEMTQQLESDLIEEQQAWE